jgi:hydrogenase/urease accessory protein HupE
MLEGPKRRDGSFRAVMPDRPRPTFARIATIVAAVAGMLSFSSVAQAHAVGLSTGTYVANGTQVDAEITLSRAELARSLDDLDRNGDGTIDEDELRAGRDLVAAAFTRGVLVAADAGACTASLVSAETALPDGVDVRLAYGCMSTITRLRLRLDLLDQLSRGHRHVAHLALGQASRDDILFGDHREAELRAAPGAPGASVDGQTAPASNGSRAGAWLRMGVEHILTGYDHLLFLFGLVLIGGKLRSLIGAITAFTLAHSITLALAVLGVWSPPARLVEVAIAASIVWVGVENLFVTSARGRWRLTLPFGLVHGFGFASALREVALSPAQVPVALACFNLGVEAGQLAVMAVVVPVLLYVRKRGWLGPRGTKVLSVGVIAAGAVWMVQRAIG